MLKIKDLSKSYGDRIIFKELNLRIEEGEFVVLFGPNGCGKTTLLDMIAGITSPDLGKIRIDNKAPKEQQIGYVFQNYRDSLLPWKTNLDNITFPLELKRVKNRRLIAKRLIRDLDLKIPINNYPYESSGGEQQKVAILREIISEPRLILMDEPFSALHHENREELRVKLQEIQKRLHLTIIFVSHNITEAIQLADKILLVDPINKKIGKTIKVYLPRPRSQYTSKFLNIRKEIENEIKKDNHSDLYHSSMGRTIKNC